MLRSRFALTRTPLTTNRHRPRRMRLPSPNRQTPRPAHPNPPLRSKTPPPRRPVVELQGRRWSMVVESHCHVRRPQTQTHSSFVAKHSSFVVIFLYALWVYCGWGWSVLRCVACVVLWYTALLNSSSLLSFLVLAIPLLCPFSLITPALYLPFLLCLLSFMSYHILHFI